MRSTGRAAKPEPVVILEANRRIWRGVGDSYRQRSRKSLGMADMDSNLLSALIGFGGGLLGVLIGAYLQQRVTDGQLSRQTTLQLYDRLDDPDILESRIRADRLLAANAALARPQCLSELYVTLPRDDWQHISRTRHFLDQIGLLRRVGYLDANIAVPLFSGFIDYWVGRYFAPLEELEREFAKENQGRPQQWRVTGPEFKKLFPKEV
jgi:hypothetical protein